jgi:hypothetical protein
MLQRPKKFIKKFNIKGFKSRTAFAHAGEAAVNSYKQLLLMDFRI